ncbi:MAG: cadmium resistance transporter [Hydrococcus sp. Prado102]|jgi:cadmium resistance transport/sequestration family protein|nr:cadmium resistance transporter [Hydrococcus sp. Prado102]
MNHLIAAIAFGGFPWAIATGISAFIATNLDDIFILLLFFSQVNKLFRHRHIVMGQYLGFATLVLASLPAFVGGMLLPPAWIGVLGIIPIAIGVSQLFNREEDDGQSPEISTLNRSKTNSLLANLFTPQTYSVATVTFANGGDNLGIYVPLFANCSWSSLAIILSIFFSLVGVWCYTAYRLANIPAIAQTLTRYGSYLVPFVLIALGISILVENHTLEEPSLMVITLTMGAIILMKSRMSEQSPEVSRD